MTEPKTDGRLSRRDVLKMGAAGLAGLALGGGIFEWINRQREPIKALRTEQDPQKILEGIMDLGNRYINGAINQFHLNQEQDIAGLLKFSGGEKGLVAARMELARPDINELINRRLPVDLGPMKVDCQPTLRQRGLMIARRLVREETVKGIKSAKVDSFKMEDAGVFQVKGDGSTVFIMALNQNGAINGKEQKYVDYALLGVKPGGNEGEEPLFVLEDFASKNAEEGLQWLDAANQQVWEGRPVILNKQIEARFNPNPLAQI